MGGCCCSSRKPHLHGTPVYYYCPPVLEEQESLTSNGTPGLTLGAGFMVNLDLEIPDTFRPPPAPLPYDTVLGCPQSTDSESFRGTVSGGSFETLPTCDDFEELESKTRASTFLHSPKKAEILKLNESSVALMEEEDSCPICLEDYDVENPKLMTQCEHHYHLSCILEWMERSDMCPICDKMEEGICCLGRHASQLSSHRCMLQLCFAQLPKLHDRKKRYMVQSDGQAQSQIASKIQILLRRFEILGLHNCKYAFYEDSDAWNCLLGCCDLTVDCSFNHGGRKTNKKWGHWTYECPSNQHQTNSKTAAADADLGEEIENTSV